MVMGRGGGKEVGRARAGGRSKAVLPFGVAPGRCIRSSRRPHILAPPRLAILVCTSNHSPPPPHTPPPHTLVGASPRTHMAMPKASAHSTAHSPVTKLKARQKESRQSWPRCGGPPSGALLLPTPGPPKGSSSARSFMPATAGWLMGSEVEEPGGEGPKPPLRPPERHSLARAGGSAVEAWPSGCGAAAAAPPTAAARRGCACPLQGRSAQLPVAPFPELSCREVRAKRRCGSCLGAVCVKAGLL